MKFKPVKPSQRTLSFLSIASEGFILLSPFDMTSPDWSEADKGNSCTFSQIHHFHENSHRNVHFLLKLHKALVGDHYGKFFLHMSLDITLIKMFQIFENPTMKQNHIFFFNSGFCKAYSFKTWSNSLKKSSTI